MKVYHSFFNPVFDAHPMPRLVAYVEAVSGVSDSLETAVFAISETHGTGVVQRGHYFLPGFGYFWNEGVYPEAEQHVAAHEEDVCHGAEAMVERYNNAKPVDSVRR